MISSLENKDINYNYSIVLAVVRLAAWLQQLTRQLVSRRARQEHRRRPSLLDQSKARLALRILTLAPRCRAFTSATGDLRDLLLDLRLCNIDHEHRGLAGGGIGGATAVASEPEYDGGYARRSGRLRVGSV